LGHIEEWGSPDFCQKAQQILHSPENRFFTCNTKHKRPARMKAKHCARHRHHPAYKMRQCTHYRVSIGALVDCSAEKGQLLAYKSLPKSLRNPPIYGRLFGGRIRKQMHRHQNRDAIHRFQVEVVGEILDRYYNNNVDQSLKKFVEFRTVHGFRDHRFGRGRYINDRLLLFILFAALSTLNGNRFEMLQQLKFRSGLDHVLDKATDQKQSVKRLPYVNIAGTRGNVIVNRPRQVCISSSSPFIVRQGQQFGHFLQKHIDQRSQISAGQIVGNELLAQRLKS
jgi:hypothetical protein